MSTCSDVSGKEEFGTLHAPVAQAWFANASETHVVGAFVVLQLLLRRGKRDAVVAKVDESGAAAVGEAVVG